MPTSFIHEFIHCMSDKCGIKSNGVICKPFIIFPSCATSVETQALANTQQGYKATYPSQRCYYQTLSWIETRGDFTDL